MHVQRGHARALLLAGGGAPARRSRLPAARQPRARTWFVTTTGMRLPSATALSTLACRPNSSPRAASAAAPSAAAAAAAAAPPPVGAPPVPPVPPVPLSSAVRSSAAMLSRMTSLTSRCGTCVCVCVRGVCDVRVCVCDVCVTCLCV
jgi:hypothetical protein